MDDIVDPVEGADKAILVANIANDKPHSRIAVESLHIYASSHHANR